MKLIDIKNVGVIGGGLMGHGIAIQFARYGYTVNLNDTSEEKLKESLDNILSTCKTMSKSGIIKNDEINKIISNINTDISLKKTCENSDFIIEAVFEDLKIKEEIFSKEIHLLYLIVLVQLVELLRYQFILNVLIKI